MERKMIELVAAFIGIIAGAGGYLLATFWFQPILKYREIRSQIISDIIFYANAVKADGMNDAFKQRVLDRMVANRRHSADLAACFHELPCLYRSYLMKIEERPDNASVELMGLSNTSEWEAASQRIDAIQKYLKIDPKVTR